MAIRFYNTLTRRKEIFEPLEPKKVRMYNCGPTVYNFVHIGNCRAFMLADLLRRYLEYRGYEVTQVMNITDVGHLVSDADEGEDKMELAAKQQKRDIWELADFYIKAFFEDIETLNMKKASVYPRATEHIEDMIKLIKRLEERGFAYKISDGVYFDLMKFPQYGRLSGNTLEELQAGARVKVNPEKKSPFDFALWWIGDEFMMKWESPWGVGRPGWHIECSAMSMKYLGEQLDIHTGGEDNIFPHHEDEIAQSEAATGKQFVKYWLHTRHLLVDNQKMSKSLGNFYTLRDLLERGYDPMSIRYILLATHYRMPLNFTLEGLDAARNSLMRIKDFVIRMREAEGDSTCPELPPLIEKARNDFIAALDDDLNISPALAAIFNFIHQANKLNLGKADAEKALALIGEFDAVLGLKLLEEEKIEDEEIERLIKEREEARKRRDFKRADEIRDSLKARGIILEDTPRGTRWKRI